MKMPNKLLSGVQLIVSSLNPAMLKDNTSNPRHFPVTFDENETHACATCGGKLTELNFPKSKSFSGCWLTSQELEAKDEDHVCSACKWFLTTSNRQVFLHTNYFTVFNGKTVREFTAGPFLDFLRKGFDEPVVIAILGYKTRLQKNVAWKLNRTVCYNQHDAKVAMLGIDTAHGCYDGTAAFDADDLIAEVEQLLPLAKRCRELAETYPFSKSPLWGQYYYTLNYLQKIVKACGSWSEEMFLATYLAANLALPFEERTANKGVSA